MGGAGVIDRFLEVFTRYINSGFGLLGGEVAFIATTLIVIDMTMAALFWSWGADEDIIARLVKKTLFVGVFAYIIGNWNALAKIVFESFAGLGLKASGTGFSTTDLLRPGRVAQVGLDAGRPILESISGLMGYIAFFENFIQIVVLLFAWVILYSRWRLIYRRPIASCVRSRQSRDWKTCPMLARCCAFRAMVDLYCESFHKVPRRITLDIDDTFDAVHGGQQLRLFNAHYDEYGFQPIVIFDGEGRFITAVLRPAKRPSGKEIRCRRLAGRHSPLP